MESNIATQPYVPNSGKTKRDRTSYLYIAVIVAVFLGILGSSYLRWG